ncbi:MAG: toll/interleukin-1 receptor domain-containing protein [Deltaproteobacteria bacterium]|nr:toll/interleukin-1 receptor domain-containing protein [Deltaproteobacteria bacterium]
MADVFISYIHEEQRIAQAVQALLKQNLQPIVPNGVFLSADDWQVFAGEIWLERIAYELREASVVVLMLSAESVVRPWVNFEAGAAWLAKKALIPVCFGGLTKGRMPKPYSGIQGLDLPDDWYYLLRSVQRHLDPNGLPVPPPTQSHEVAELQAALKGEAKVYPPPPRLPNLPVADG